MYQQGRLYQYDGEKFIELEPAEGKKLPVTDEAMEAVKAIRAAASKRLRARPELSVVASALILSCAEDQGSAIDAVIWYGTQLYTQAQPVTRESAHAMRPEPTPAELDF